ncbi:MAG: branched-chain amino acid ABC transporter permease [Candidatus Bathyarchaeota archaeon B23]|nr:MAG: branched-chain amino acid ABC transporter permease [Candidatus Bathyarchaeota archaeon B23]
MTYEFFNQWIIDLVFFLILYLIVTMNLNFLYGYTGIPHFGISLSVAGGGYVAGALTGRILRGIYNVYPQLNFMYENTKITNEINVHLQHDPFTGISIFLFIIALSLLINAGLGYIVSRPAIRLSGTYLIIVLIGMAEAVRIIGLNYYPLVGGTFWVHVPDLFAWMGGFRTEGYLIISTLITLGIFLLLQAMSTSPLGRVLRAVRENPVSAECVGIDVVGVRTRVMVLCSALTSISGVLYAYYIQAVLATAYTRASWTFYPWLMCMVGGIGNNMGAFIGTLIFITVRRLIIYYKHDIEAYIPFQVVWLEMIMIGLALLVIIMFHPEGLIPEKPTKVRGLNYKRFIEELERRGIKVPKRSEKKNPLQRLFRRMREISVR